jgi:hypothetical protein
LQYEIEPLNIAMIAVKVFNEVLKKERSSKAINQKLKEIIDFCKLSGFNQE